MKRAVLFSASLIILFYAIGLAMSLAAQERVEKIPPQDRITIHELKRKLDRKEKVTIIDGRAGSSYLGSTVRIKGSIHITADELQARIGEIPKDIEVVVYCT